MLTSATIKSIKALHRKINRKEQSLFIAEGDKICRELLQSNYGIKGIYALKHWIENNETLLSGKDCVYEITEKELSRISALKTPNNALIVARSQTINPKDIDLKANITIVLDNIQDAGNLGTIIRTADWFGVRNIVCSDDTVELYNPKVIQSTMGSFLRLNVIHTELSDFFNTVAAKFSIPVYGASLDGEKLSETKPPKECLLVIGNESKGISKELQKYITSKITIPAFINNPGYQPESLNAAIATSIIISWFKMRS
ncbi:MAG: RNA methyltransferase [Bacteroidales bacterium]